MTKEIITTAKNAKKEPRIPTPMWGILFGLGLALVANNAEAAPGITISPELAQWVPAAIIELLAFAGGAAKSFGLTGSNWYSRTVAAKNLQLRDQIWKGVEPQVVEKFVKLKTAGRLKLPDGKSEEEYLQSMITENVEAQFDPLRIRMVNPVIQAMKEGARMAAGFGGPGIMICDAIIGLGWGRLAVDAVYGIGGFAWMVGLDPKERLMADTLD